MCACLCQQSRLQSRYIWTSNSNIMSIHQNDIENKMMWSLWYPVTCNRSSLNFPIFSPYPPQPQAPQNPQVQHCRCSNSSKKPKHHTKPQRVEALESYPTESQYHSLHQKGQPDVRFDPLGDSFDAAKKKRLFLVLGRSVLSSFLIYKWFLR